MSNLNRMVGDIPTPALVVGGVAIGGGLVGAVAMIRSTWAIVAVVVGLVLIAAVWFVYSWLLKRREKKQAAMMSQSLASSAGTAPTAISNPARRARMDDLRKNFETGIEKFKAADKDVYSVPWYLVVGEPGSGKTEAIRHCKIGFPPGLQDPLQGSGGTVNMHWWFTNHGVFLDTAGRLMFEEVAPGESSEWQEFLKLLVKARPNCPVNGMLLFIPADSLIKDTAEQLERKGGRIAQQLDQIQRIVGVRFPVYVIIAKCDLVNGFREFFDDINDPKLQDQIMGWSNPNALDVAFKPELVDQYLREVQQRLVRRRYGTIMDPVHTEDPKLRRTDQVDALFAFPDSLTKLGSRLRRYLEMVFVAGQWSAKPLFLRGIYFTSSMREGSALDQELAEALGVEIERLPEGRVWEKDRSFFLRDVFMDKAFPEQGLVSRATNVSQQLRTWRYTVLGLMCGGALLLGVFSWFGYTRLNEKIVKPSEFWSGSSEVFIKDGETPVGSEIFYRPIVKKEGETYRYQGDSSPANKETNDALLSIKGLSAEYATLGKFPTALKDHATRPVEVPAVFYPIAVILGDRGNLLQGQRMTSARMLFEGSWMRPVMAAAKDRMNADTNANRWSSEATDALTSFVRLESGGVEALSSEQKAELGPPSVDAMLKYAVGPEQFAQQAKKDAEEAQTFAAWLYNLQGGKESWPSGAFLASNADLIDRGVKTFNAVWADKATFAPDANAGKFPNIQALLDALKQYNDRELDLFKIADHGDIKATTKEWSDKLTELVAIEQRIDAQMDALGKRGLREAYADELKSFRVFAGKQYDALLDALKFVKPNADGKPSALVADVGDKDKRVGAMVKWHRALTDAKAELGKESDAMKASLAEAEKLDRLHLSLSSAPRANFKTRMEMYQTAAAALKQGPDTKVLKPGEVGGVLDAIAARLKSQKESTAANRPSAEGLGKDLADRYDQAALAAGRMLGIAARGQRTTVVEAFLKLPYVQSGEIDAAVRGLATDPKELAAPKLPLVGWKGNEGIKPEFALAAAARVVADYRSVNGAIKESSQGALVFQREQLEKAFGEKAQFLRDYLRRHAEYWALTADRLESPELTWEAAQQQLAGVIAGTSVGAMTEAVARVESASTLIQDVLRDVPEMKGITEFDRLTKAASSSKATLGSISGKFDEALGAWKRLSAEATKAQQELVSPGPSMTSTYFVFPSAEEVPGDVVSRYLRHLWCGLAKSLAREQTGAPLVRSVTTIRSLGERFPLDGDVDDVRLTPEDVRTLRQHIDAFTAAGPNVGSKTIPITTPIACLTQHLESIQQSQSIDVDAAAYARKIAVAYDAMFPKSGGALTCTIVAKSAAGQPGTVLNEVIPNWQLFSGPDAMGQIAQVFNAKPEGYPLGTIEIPSAGDLKIRMTDQGKQELLSVPLPAQWGVLDYVARTSRKVDGSRKIWAVDVQVDYQGKPHTMKLELRLNRDIPDGLKWVR